MVGLSSADEDAAPPVAIAGFGNHAAVFASKQWPKTLTVFGDDLRTYEFVVKVRVSRLRVCDVFSVSGDEFRTYEFVFKVRIWPNKNTFWCRCAETYLLGHWWSGWLFVSVVRTFR